MNVLYLMMCRTAFSIVSFKIYFWNIDSVDKIFYIVLPIQRVGNKNSIMQILGLIKTKIFTGQKIKVWSSGQEVFTKDKISIREEISLDNGQRFYSITEFKIKLTIAFSIINILHKIKYKNKNISNFRMR